MNSKSFLNNLSRFSQNTSKKTLYTFLLFMVTIIWGVGYVILKIALNLGIQPFTLTSVRLLSCTAFILFYIYLKKIKITREEIKIGIISGILLGGAMCIQTTGMSYTTVSKNVFLTNTFVLITPLLMGIFLKKLPSKSSILASLACLSGIGILTLGDSLYLEFGDILSFISAFFYSFQMIHLGFTIKDKNPLVVTCFQFLTGGVLAFILSLIFEDAQIFKLNLTLESFFPLFYLTVFNMLISYSIQNASQKYVEPNIVSLIISQTIVIATILSIIFLGDPLTYKVILGGVLIFGSIIFSILKDR